MKIALSLLLTLIPLSSFAGSITLSGTCATEANGNGWAFRQAGWDAGENSQGHGDVLPGGINPIQYAPLPIDPSEPDGPGSHLDPGISQMAGEFNFGTLTWDDNSVTQTGPGTLPVTNAMFLFDFDVYFQALVNEIEIGATMTSEVTLSNIVGPGLVFEDGVLITANFTADIGFQGLFNDTIPWAEEGPFPGTLTVVNGQFAFDLADEPRTLLFGSTPSEFEFDLIATPDALKLPTIPTLEISQPSSSQITLTTTFENPSNDLFQIQETSCLSTPDWQPLGTTFAASGTNSQTFLISTPSRFFQITSAPAGECKTR